MARAGDGVGVTERLGETQLAAWTTAVTNECLNNLPLIPMLREKDLIEEVKQGGGEYRWIFYKKLHKLRGHVDNRPRPFPRTNRPDNARMDWALYEVEESNTLFERAQHGGKATIVDQFEGIADQMAESANEQLEGEFWRDGSATDDIDFPIFGCEAWAGGYDDAAQDAEDELATSLTGSYAGISMGYDAHKPGAVEGDPQYGLWSPAIVNCNQDDGSGAAASWENNADIYLRRGIFATTKGKSKTKRIDVGFLRRPSFEQLLNLLDDKERVILEGSQQAKAYGFDPTGAINFDGAMFLWSNAIPATDALGKVIHGYGLNSNKMKLLLLPADGGIRGKGALWTFYESKDEYQRLLWQLILFCALVFTSPRYHAAWKEISTY